MASGFIILQDGRAFAPRWSAYDTFLEAIANELNRSSNEIKFAEWLRELTPEPDDLEHLGYGPWLRSADEAIIDRYLDLRELTLENQRLFHLGAQRAFTRCVTSQNATVPREWIPGFKCLLTMLKFVHQGRPPSELSDWRDGYTEPPTGKRLGPGW